MCTYMPLYDFLYLLRLFAMLYGSETLGYYLGRVSKYISEATVPSVRSLDPCSTSKPKRGLKSRLISFGHRLWLTGIGYGAETFRIYVTRPNKCHARILDQQRRLKCAGDSSTMGYGHRLIGSFLSLILEQSIL
jgi:hypothetical protein